MMLFSHWFFRLKVIFQRTVVRVYYIFRFKQKITGVTDDNNTKNVEIRVPLNYSSSFWRTLEMHLSNCEINLILTWSDKCVLSNVTKLSKVPVAALSTRDNAKLLQKLKSGFKRIIN